MPRAVFGEYSIAVFPTRVLVVEISIFLEVKIRPAKCNQFSDRTDADEAIYLMRSNSQE